MRLNDLKWGALCLLALTACSDDKNKVDNPEGPQGNGSMEVMNPDQSKVFLEETAEEFLDKFNPEDQRDVIELAAYFDKVYADCEAPDNFDLDNDYNISRYLRHLAKAAQGDLDALTRAAYDFSYRYDINFERFMGVYRADLRNEKWVLEEKSNDIVFRFSNAAGEPVELKITQSGGTSDFDYSYIEEEWDHDSYDYRDVQYQYYLSIPKNLKATLTSNGTQLASSTVVSSIDVKGHKISGDADATLMNLRAVAKVSGDDSKVEARTEFYVNNGQVASAYATLEGANLCNIDRYEQLEEIEDEDTLYTELNKMFKSANCGLDIMGKVQVYGQGTYYRELPQDADSWYDSYDFSSKAVAQRACQDACDRLNKSIKTQLRYNNTSTDQATFFFQPGFDSWGADNWEYYVDGVLLFPDGMTYSLERYFKKFTNISSKFDTVVDAYESIWRQARR